MIGNGAEAWVFFGQTFQRRVDGLQAGEQVESFAARGRVPGVVQVDQDDVELARRERDEAPDIEAEVARGKYCAGKMFISRSTLWK